MDEDKMKTLLDEYLQKSNANMQKLLEEKLNKMEEILKKDINELRTTVEGIEKSQEVISTNFDRQKSKIQDLINDNKKIHLENVQLKKEIDETNTKQEENEIKINQLEQYNRSSFMLEISGIPRKTSEDAVKLIEKVAIKAKIMNFNTEQIDVAHRTSRKATAPIIVLFKTKSDRNNFFKQKRNIFSVSAEQIVQYSNDTDDVGEVSMPGLEDGTQNNRKKGSLFINESLTHTNRILLKEARSISKQLNYKFAGYTVNGEVRVRKSDHSEHIAILSKKDLLKI